MSRPFAAALLAGLASLALGDAATAQPLGTFRWQMRPYCNVLTLSVTQAGGIYRLEGTDDQCGAGRDRAAAQGLAFLNPDGTIGFGLTIVTAPGGAPVHVDAQISLASLGGTWRVPSGNSGAFVYTPGAPVPGMTRPDVAPVVPPSISLSPGGSLVARANGDAAIPASGAGSRMMWYSGKAAFRVGTVNGGQWDDASVGLHSAAFGLNTVASGLGSAAFGTSTTASGARSAAFGASTNATGAASAAFGSATTASGGGSTALGGGTQANGDDSLAFGWDSISSGLASVAGGSHTTASATASTALGSYTVASGADSIAGGFTTTAAGRQALAFGDHVAALASHSVVLGSRASTTAAAEGSFVLADNTSGSFQSSAPNEFGARFAGGFYLYTSGNLGAGAALAPGSGTWASLSDVNAKENFRAVDGEDVLARLARIPIREWNYRTQDAAIRHLGPTAQDFRAAFGLGDFPERINTVDADGVALAAAQAVGARTDRLRADLEALREENAELRARLAALERLVGSGGGR